MNKKIPIKAQIQILNDKANEKVFLSNVYKELHEDEMFQEPYSMKLSDLYPSERGNPGFENFMEVMSFIFDKTAGKFRVDKGELAQHYVATLLRSIDPEDSYQTTQKLRQVYAISDVPLNEDKDAPFRCRNDNNYLNVLLRHADRLDGTIGNQLKGIVESLVHKNENDYKKFTTANAPRI